MVRNWLRNRGTLEYLSVWEQIYNPNFKVFESEHFKKQAGLLTFTPSVSEWVNETNAIGLCDSRLDRTVNSLIVAKSQTLFFFASSGFASLHAFAVNPNNATFNMSA